MYTTTTTQLNKICSNIHAYFNARHMPQGYLFIEVVTFLQAGNN